MNPYKTLGAHKKSSDEDIEKAYKSLVKQHHPDRGGDVAKFTYIKECYEAIKDKTARRKFDESLYMEDRCVVCQGRGVTWQSKGLAGKIYSACNHCHGSGWSSLEDDTEEEEEDDTVITL